MLMHREKSALLVVDVQTRLLPAIHGGDEVLANCVWLVGVAKRLGVPTVVSEQYPQGLGRTEGSLRSAASDAQWVEKLHFSCVADGCLVGSAVEERRQVVVCGTEAHVCVQQSALELRWQGKEVFVVADAVGSRVPDNKSLALERMRAHGIEIVSREMVAFEWLHRAASDDFRAINTAFIR